MPTELTAAPEPDEAVLVFKKRGSGGISGLRPGSQISITNVADPQQSIRAEIATARELATQLRDTPQSFDDFGSLLTVYQLPNLQQFQVVTEPFAPGASAPLTSRELLERIVPIVMALSELQRVLYGTEPILRSITQNSPVNISMEGAGSLYEKMATDIIPWRRERAKQLAELEVAKSRAHLAQQRAEVLTAEAVTERQRAESETAAHNARAAKAEADLKEMELIKARYQLAIEIVNQMLPGPMTPEKMQMIAQMMPELTKLTGAIAITTL